MSDTTKGVPRAELAGDAVVLPLANTAKTYKRGWLMNVNADGYLKSGEDAASERFAGIAVEEVEVEANGSNGDEWIKVRQEGVFLFDFDSTLTEADLEMAAYVADNQLMARYGDVSNYVFAGVIKRIESDCQAWVKLVIPQLADLADAVS